jgi:putative transposase
MSTGGTVTWFLRSGRWPLAHDYRKLLDQFGMQTSMSRKGNCYDNAPMESFWGSLKNELTHHQHYETHAHAKAAIQECIEIYSRVM